MPCSSGKSAGVLDAGNDALAKHPVTVIAPSWQRRGWQLGVAIALGMSGAIPLSGNQAIAQIMPDATLGAEPSVVTPNVNIRGLSADQIDGGAVRGANLFHSFQEFNVGNGQRVYFANPTGIENILSRVTGSNPSNILGTLGVNGTASLFLLNPNGIIFGPNAQLDIAGSLLATTANSLVFNNGSEFSAKNPQAPPLLTVNLRPGLQYGSKLSGAIANAGNLAVGQDLTLAAENLDLQGQLHAGANLTLQALNTLRIRDSLTNPFIAFANGQLLVQGNQAVDIFALNHPASGFFSGEDTVLRSANTVGGDAHYTAGGSFRIEQLDGSLGNLFSPYDPIIRARGNVNLAGYRGGSLHIFAGGSVTILGDVTITRADANAIAESVPLSDGTTVLIDGRVQPTLDIRAGTTAFGTPSFGGTPTSGAITIGGSITNVRGMVFLTNQYNPNLQLPPGAISTGSIRAFGGLVTIDARDSIRIPSGINTSINNGTGGNIKLLSGPGGIDTRGAILTAGSGNGNGGDIILSATGNIFTDAIRSFVSLGATGNGGDIILISENGAIDTSGGDVTSVARRGNAGNVLMNAFGNITTANIKSFVANTGQTGLGNGGNIVLSSTTGAIDTTGGILFSSTDSGNGGRVSLTAAGNIFTGSIQSLVGFRGKGFAGDITLFSQNGAIDTTAFTIDDQGKVVSGIQSVVGDEGLGFGGDVTLTALGNITTADIASRVGTGGVGFAGKITLTSGGEINTRAGTLSSDSPDRDSGDITLTAFGNIIPGNIRSTNSGFGKAGDITLFSSNGNIFVVDRSINSETLGFGQGGNANITAQSVFLADKALLATNTYGTGNSGNVSINTQFLSLTGGAEVLAQTFGAGRAGNIIVNASDSVILSGVAPFTSLTKDGDNLIPDGGFSSGLFATTEENATGSGGNIVINTGTLRLENGAALSARTRGVARGGDITVNVNNLDITGGAQILTTAFSSGAAGGITVNATGNVTISGIDPTFVERFNQIRDAFIAEGVSPEQAFKNAQFTIDPVDASSSLQAQALNRISQGSGNIIIEAGSLSLMNGGQLTANTYGRGNAGNIDIKVRDTVSLSGLATLRRDGVSSLLNSGIFSLVGEGAVDANGGNINIKARSLFMADRSEIGVGTFGIGNAGNVSVQVDDSVALDQVSSIRSNVEPRGIGKGGNVDIQARSLTLTNGGQIGAFVFRAENNKLGGTGQGGDITINAWDSVSISGFSADPLNPGLSFSSGLLASTENGAVGPGGTITVNTGNLFIADSGFITAATENNSKAGSVFLNVNDQLTVQNEGVVLVSGLAQGDPGNLVITAGSVFLNQGGRLEAISNSGKNANISLTVSDSIQLRSTDPFLSRISAQAFNQGDGGNIDIIAGNNIIGVRAENSDILANAYGGNGGNITAVARTGGVIGFNDSKVPTPESDFIASSELALDGTVEIETQDKLQEALPINLVDATGLIDRRCSATGESNVSSFTITNRGGLPPNPGDPLRNDAVVSNWVSLDSDSDTEKKTSPAAVVPTPTTANQIVEAQGWELDSKGKVVLTAQAQTVTPQGDWYSFPECNTREPSNVQPTASR